jgi:hypothetical protein
LRASAHVDVEGVLVRGDERRAFHLPVRYAHYDGVVGAYKIYTDTVKIAEYAGGDLDGSAPPLVDDPDAPDDPVVIHDFGIGRVITDPVELAELGDIVDAEEEP